MSDKIVQLLPNAWSVYLSAQFTDKEFTPESVYGPNGSLVDDRATVYFEIKNPETGLWRSADRAFPGEEFRVAFRANGPRTRYEDPRREYEQQKSEEGQDRILYSQGILERKLARAMSIIFVLMIFVALASGFQIGFAIFSLGIAG